MAGQDEGGIKNQGRRDFEKREVKAQDYKPNGVKKA